ncbi:redoxin domain-containing protein [Rhizobium leguminosarum]|uniref:Redoxin domain-containing protein n=1 Tax=Rhizobium leguminosarum TaxID=384 RepID=A0A444I4C5_RHILE|nr:redoxin family protein [Rhizobium leguminosarum]RWX32420.1 redoxin domain-containing protein [Rhizobium leguminosarum]
MKHQLSIGSPAPSIKMLAWLQGAPMPVFQPGWIYILVYLSTTCGCCETALSDLETLQEMYRDIGVEVIGVVAKEPAPTADEARSLVETWLADRLSNSDVRIAYDYTGEMDKHWMDASLSFWVPQAFVVSRNGTIAYIGDPNSLECILDHVVDGSWDSSAEAREAEKERLAECEVYELERALEIQIASAIEVRDWKRALSATKEAIKSIPDNPTFREAHVELLMRKLHDFEAGWIALGRFARGAIERNSADWLLAAMRQLFCSPYEYSSLPFAERFSMGKELSDCILRLCPQQDALSRAESYQTIASYYHENGEKSRAVELVEQALALVQGETLSDDVKQEWIADLMCVLGKYKH